MDRLFIYTDTHARRRVVGLACSERYRLGETPCVEGRARHADIENIAALLGPTLIVGALMVLMNLNAMPSLIEGFSRDPMLIVIAGYASFVPRLGIVYFHNRWSGGWPILITAMGWLSVIVGCCASFSPLNSRSWRPD